MRRAELLRPGSIELRTVPDPAPGPGELVVRVAVALTCGTDIKTFQRGHPKIALPAPLGHEFAGTVAAVGEGVSDFRAGDEIVCAPTAPCGECRVCARGQDSLCPLAVGRIVLGAFADYVCVPSHIVRANTFLRPASLSAEAAALLEPLACVVHGVSRTRLSQAEHVIIVGDGPIALLFAMLARLRSAANVLLVGKHASRLQVAESVGLQAVLVRGHELRDAALDHTNGVGADVVIECVGRPEVWETAFSCVAVGGELLAFGGCPAGASVNLDAYRIHYEEVDVKGAFHYGRADVQRAFELLVSGALPAQQLITHHRRLDQIDEALQLVLDRSAIKVAVTP